MSSSPDPRLTQLTVEEKARLLAGATFWNTVEIARLGIRSVAVSDGPHGLRKQEEGGDHLAIGGSVAATCFPPAAGLASSWDVELVERVGVALGTEAAAEHVAVLLGPGVNIKRSPLCGRNFEYFSEDPLLSGELGVAYVNGLQSRGVGASVKHFAANNQETERMTVSAEVDERTLREIYLPAFEAVVTRAKPRTVMCSYNRINGVYAGESRWLLSTVLREEWGFDGLVVSDWGAVDDRVAGVAAGLDLEMPGPQPSNEKRIVDAVRSGALAKERLDESVSRVLALVDRSRQDAAPAFDADAHHALARAAAAASIVLLRNEGGILPLVEGAPVAVIGEFARTPRFQGAGSSTVNPTRVDTALDAIRQRAEVAFEPGYSLGTTADPALAETAVALAARSEVVLLFVGLPDREESEGYDRKHLLLPREQRELIASIAEVNPHTVVVLSNGGVVSLEGWHDSVAGILETWLLGQAGGSAVAQVLFGEVNPSGRLAETIPVRLQDTPSYLNFPGENGVVRYGEGIFVGYRHYQKAEVAVRYPFGFGLSYTSFGYSELSATRDAVSVTVTNTGASAGSDVVQVYVASPELPVRMPVRELRGFARVTLEPGESKRVTVPLNQRSFSYYDTVDADWVIGGGDYTVQVGRSSEEILLEATLRLKSTRAVAPLGLDSPVSAWVQHPVTGPIFRRASAKERPGEGGASVFDMVASMPMRRLIRFPGVDVTERQLTMLQALANNRVIRGIAGLFARR